MTKLLLFIAVFLFVIQFNFGQVGINNPNPDNSSILDVKSIDKGLLIPRWTAQMRKAQAASSANGLLVYDTDERMIYYFDSTANCPTRIECWVGLSPLRSFYTEKNPKKVDTSNVYQRDVITDSLFRRMGLATGNPQNTLSVNGNLSVGDSNTTTAPDNGIYSSGEIKSDNTITATNFIGNGTIPVGGIIMWSGDTNNLPSSWQLCNGGNIIDSESSLKGTATPNLSGRFIVGVGGSESYTVGEKGGANSVSLLPANLPPHQHEAKGNGATINIASSGSHRHPYNDHYMNESSNSGDWADGDGTGGADRAKNTSYSSHTHPNTSFAGMTGNGNGLNSTAHENRPSYYALAYIMRIK